METEFKNEDKSNQLLDFTNMFKQKGKEVKAPILGCKKEQTSPNWLLEVPAKITIQKKHLRQRKVFDMRRWANVSKGKNNRLLHCVATSWNYLFPQHQITLSQAKQAFGAQNDNIQDQEMGLTAKKWFETLLKLKQVDGSASDISKMVECKQKLLEGLRSSDRAYIYMNFTTCICPVGYEFTPQIPLDAYQELGSISEENLELWIINCQVDIDDRAFFIKRWKHMQLGLTTEWPYYFDLNYCKAGQKSRLELEDYIKAESTQNEEAKQTLGDKKSGQVNSGEILQNEETYKIGSEWAKKGGRCNALIEMRRGN